MTIAYADLIAAFPEFSDPISFPPAQVAFWIPQAYAMLSADRFGVQVDLAAMLFVAHSLVLSARNNGVANSGGIAGQAHGAVSSKGLGKASISYTTGTEIPGAGAWNYTSYGQRLYTMMRAFSTGPTYVPGPCRPADPFLWGLTR